MLRRIFGFMKPKNKEIVEVNQQEKQNKKVVMRLVIDHNQIKRNILKIKKLNERKELYV